MVLISLYLLDTFMVSGFLGGKHLAFDYCSGNAINEQHNIRFDVLFILDDTMSNRLLELVGDGKAVILEILGINEADTHSIFGLAKLERLLSLEPFAEFLVAVYALELMNDGVCVLFGDALVTIQLDDGLLEILENKGVVIGIPELLQFIGRDIFPA